jgi:hypothetical protein
LRKFENRTHAGDATGVKRRDIAVERRGTVQKTNHTGDLRSVPQKDVGVECCAFGVIACVRVVVARSTFSGTFLVAAAASSTALRFVWVFVDKFVAIVVR